MQPFLTKDTPGTNSPHLVMSIEIVCSSIREEVICSSIQICTNLLCTAFSGDKANELRDIWSDTRHGITALPMALLLETIIMSFVH